MSVVDINVMINNSSILGPPATNTVTANNEDIENIDTKCTSSL